MSFDIFFIKNNFNYNYILIMSTVIDTIIEKAKANKKHIVLSEGFDPRMQQAAIDIVKQDICKVTLLGEKELVLEWLKDKWASDEILEKITLIDPENSERNEEFATVFYEKRKHKGISLEDATTLSKKFLYFANLMVKTQKADGCVAGAFSTSGDVIRSSLQVIGPKKWMKVVSSYFMMILKDGRTVFYSDCGLVVNPDAESLATIARTTAETCNKLTGEEPKVAMLSFSTKGSGWKDPSVLKVQEATQLVREQDPNLCIDGELQFDAAFVPEIREKKAPNSSLSGDANVFVFPNLDAGNIAYKITQRIGGAQAIGPLIQGLAYPSFDLSRGCNSDDIVKTAAICAVVV